MCTFTRRSFVACVKPFPPRTFACFRIHRAGNAGCEPGTTPTFSGAVVMSLGLKSSPLHGALFGCRGLPGRRLVSSPDGWRAHSRLLASPCICRKIRSAQATVSRRKQVSRCPPVGEHHLCLWPSGRIYLESFSPRCEFLTVDCMSTKSYLLFLRVVLRSLPCISACSSSVCVCVWG